MSCADPSQELSNGFCYTRCPNGYSGSGAVCLQNCPTNFVDHGAVCEAPSFLRQTIKAFLMACQQGQIDRNGDCFEPQTFSLGPQGAVQSGCGCIKRSREQRLQCPNGYVKFNNSCVSECPRGYRDILDPLTGKINSLYCTMDCPMQDNSKLLWATSGQMCIKPSIKRLRHKIAGVDQIGNYQTGPEFGAPSSVLSTLASKPLGSSVNDRVRTGQTVGQSNAVSNSLLNEGWKQLGSSPIQIAIIVGIIVLAIIGRPLFNGIFSFFSSVAKSAGNVVEGASSVTKSALVATADAVNIAATAENNIAKSIAR